LNHKLIEHLLKLKAMKTKALLITALIVTFFFSGNAQEKEKRFGFEVSTGASVAMKKLGGSTLNPGVGFEGIFHYRFIDHTGIYGGWGWNRFGADISIAGNDVCFEETGYVLGLQFKHPIGESATSYYFRAGGLYNHIEIENADGDITHDSGHGLGWQLAGGVDFQLGKNWSLTPGIKFNALNRDVQNAGVDVPLELNYLQVRVGILKRF
jgi:opacity protein-like surface antigen